MFTHKTPAASNSLADQAARAADGAIRSTQQMTHHALDSLAGAVEEVRHDAAPLLNRAGEQASALAQRGVNAVRDGSQRLRDSAVQARDGTVLYIKDEPVKSMLIAAVAGATLMALIALFSRSRDRG